MKKALYREFRPRIFDEVLDQEQITTVLKNQIRTHSIGHAYLFSGTRGTGKTSCAKIFSRAVNCLNPKDGNPCNECENCRAILDETTLDVVEMDAASNRRIDDIRELRDKVIYPPAQLKYKVYIIDEAHMITNEAFNALLKIMEEPPAHLIFILATTEIDKVPVTILSRTQRYEFTRIDLSAIEANIRRIVELNGLSITDEACRAVAIAADGAMRDALSLLDQVIAGDEKLITQQVIDRVLGTVGFHAVAEIGDAIFKDDLSCAIRLTRRYLEAGKDAHSIVRELIDFFRRVLLVKAVADAEPILDLDDDQLAQLRAFADGVDLMRLTDSIELLIETELLIRRADYGDVLLYSAIAKLINYVASTQLTSRLEAAERKLHMVERWQDPRALVRSEVKAALDGLNLAQLAAAHPLQPEAEAPAPKAPTAVDSDAGPERPTPLTTADFEPVAYEPVEEQYFNLPDDRSSLEADPDGGAPPVSMPQPDAVAVSASTPQPDAAPVAAPETPMPSGPSEHTALLNRSRDLIVSRFREASGLPEAIIMKLDRFEEINGLVRMIFPTNAAFIMNVLSQHSERFAEILSELLGEKVDLLIGTTNHFEPIRYADPATDSASIPDVPADRAPEPPPEAEERCESDDGSEAVIKRLKELIPADILKIDDADSTH